MRTTCLFLMRSLLLGHFVKLVKLPRSKLCKLGHKYPEVSGKKRGMEEGGSEGPIIRISSVEQMSTKENLYKTHYEVSHRRHIFTCSGSL